MRFDILGAKVLVRELPESARQESEDSALSEASLLDAWQAVLLVAPMG